MTETITIVPMMREHTEALARIEQECFSHPWTQENLIEELDNRTARFFTALSGDTPVGYIGTFVAADSCYLSNIAVRSDHRRRGVGKALLMKASEQAAREGAASISLEVRPSNAPAIALYASLDFEEVGLRRRFYRDPPEDALIMTRTLTQDHSRKEHEP